MAKRSAKNSAKRSTKKSIICIATEICSLRRFMSRDKVEYWQRKLNNKTLATIVWMKILRIVLSSKVSKVTKRVAFLH